MLDYLELFLREVSGVLRRETGGKTEEPLISKLFGINFNDLHFLSFLQEQVQRKLSGLTLGGRYEFLQEQSCRIPQGGGCKGLGYDPAWPAVSIMFGNWLREMTAGAEQQISLTENRPSKPAEKIGLNLSVPQIACFIRLFFEEGLYVTSSLKEIFRITAQGLSSKRQTAISPGSLSQQYYSSDPMAAAAVRELLVKMIARINKHYFPAMAAISAAYLWL
jgi:hypothetical protein